MRMSRSSPWTFPFSLVYLCCQVFALRRIEASKFQKYVTNFIRGISLLMIPIAATVPSVSVCVCMLVCVSTRNHKPFVLQQHVLTKAVKHATSLSPCTLRQLAHFTSHPYGNTLPLALKQKTSATPLSRSCPDRHNLHCPVRLSTHHIT